MPLLPMATPGTASSGPQFSCPDFFLDNSPHERPGDVQGENLRPGSRRTDVQHLAPHWPDERCHHHHRQTDGEHELRDQDQDGPQRKAEKNPQLRENGGDVRTN